MPQGWGLARFKGPGVLGFELLFSPGGGELANQKIARGFCPEGRWSGLELTDT